MSLAITAASISFIPLPSVDRDALRVLKRNYASWDDSLSLQLHEWLEGAQLFGEADKDKLLNKILITSYKAPLIHPVLDNNNDLWEKAVLDEYLRTATENVLITSSRDHSFALELLTWAAPERSSALVCSPDETAAIVLHTRFAKEALAYHQAELAMQKRCYEAMRDAQQLMADLGPPSTFSAPTALGALRREADAHLAHLTAIHASTEATVTAHIGDTAARIARDTASRTTVAERLADVEAQMTQAKAANEQLKRHLGI